MINKKTLIYVLIAFILGFSVTFVVIKNLKKNKNQEVIEKFPAK